MAERGDVVVSECSWVWARPIRKLIDRHATGCRCLGVGPGSSSTSRPQRTSASCSKRRSVCPGGARHLEWRELRVSTPETATLSSTAMATITAAARTMYPHDPLPDDVYARVGDKLAGVAREDSGAARMIEDGVSRLNGGRVFVELSADERLEALKGVEGSEFFELV